MSLQSLTSSIINILKIKDMLGNGKSKEDREKYIQEKTDEHFNDEIENGKSTSFSDSVRKEKQKEIERLKRICDK